MAKITITEIDNTVYSLSGATTDNVVFVPGTSITGPSDRPVLCQSYKEFVDIFGNKPPENADNEIGTNWEYAANILVAGFPVLFRRIITDIEGNTLVEYAKANVMVDNESSGQDQVAIVTDLFGGSYGNKLNCTFKFNSNSIYFILNRSYTIGKTSSNEQIESIKLIDIVDGNLDSALDSLFNKLKNGYDTSYVNITAINEAAFKQYFRNTVKDIALSGGKDADDRKASTYGPLVYAELFDKLAYDVKFLTSGGWTNFPYEKSNGETVKIDFATAMAGLGTDNSGNEIGGVALTRQDCVAIIDTPIELPSEDVRDYFHSSDLNINTSYAASYAPWGKIVLDSYSTTTSKWMPPSFIFLKTLANSIKSGNKIWSPPAGVRRATVGDIVEMKYDVGSALLNAWQNNDPEVDDPQYINPIMRLRQYGYVIYGQRTLYRTVEGSSAKRSALQELGVRLTANEIKRRISDIALQLTFEQNNIHTWNEFRGMLDPFMSQLLNDGALYGYEIIMDENTTTNVDIDENRIVGIVRANITRAAEDFEIGFELTASSVVLVES